jgi:hypothetical protein
VLILRQDHKGSGHIHEGAVSGPVIVGAVKGDTRDSLGKAAEEAPPLLGHMCPALIAVMPNKAAEATYPFEGTQGHRFQVSRTEVLQGAVVTKNSGQVEKSVQNQAVGISHCLRGGHPLIERGFLCWQTSKMKKKKSNEK